MRIKTVVELDDSSHNSQERIERDEFVDMVLKSVGYKVYSYKVYHTQYSGRHLKTEETPDYVLTFLISRFKLFDCLKSSVKYAMIGADFKKGTARNVGMALKGREGIEKDPVIS